MTKVSLDYASNAQAGRSRLSLIALTMAGIAAALLAFVFLENSARYDMIGFLSLPVAFVATILTLIAAFPKAHRGGLLWISVGLLVAYWAAIGVMIVPKLMAWK